MCALKNVKTGAVSELETDGVFIAIGHKPATELFAGQLDMKPGGYLLTAAGLDRDEHLRASSRPAT